MAYTMIAVTIIIMYSEILAVNMCKSKTSLVKSDAGSGRLNLYSAEAVDAKVSPPTIDDDFAKIALALSLPDIHTPPVGNLELVPH